jgi:transporter family-2 protein
MIMLGFLFSIIAGAAMSFQGVMNTRLSEESDLFTTNMYVQGTAFLLSLVAFFIMGKGGALTARQGAPKPYLLGGVLGLVITVTVMLGIRDLSPTVSISVILIAQLITAVLIDAGGILGSEQVKLDWTKFVGAALMISGVLFFKWKHI